MGQQIGPRKVEPGSWRKWSQQALALQSRLKMANVILSILCVAYYMWLVQIDNLILTVLSMLVAAPVSLSLFILLAARADKRKILPSGQHWRITIRVLGLGLVNWGILILVFFSLFMLGYLISEAFNLSLQGTGSSAAAVVAERVGNVITNPYLFLAALVYAIIPLAAWYAQSLMPYVSIWFVLMLVIASPANIVQAYKLSWQAEQLNWSEVNSLSMLALILLSVILVSGGILAVVILPYLGSLMYVSYRDVFLAEGENSKIVTSSIPLTSPERKLAN
ncbi:hypothetical protein MNBD_GAMMA12-708 [hydrothermal vent metagenome]|uniref:Transmembrane protein n=1 Tax=hydrothermal vent metagenome TaxID=652676 RepID=A0A3B0Z5U1_9ZZZZ